MAKQILTRDDLSFTGGDRVNLNWNVDHGGSPDWCEQYEVGKKLAEQVVCLAENDEFEAYQAIRYALQSRNWKGDFGEENGFADTIAEFAVLGMWAVRNDKTGRFNMHALEVGSLESQLERALTRIQELEAAAA